MVEAGTLCINEDVEKKSGTKASATSDAEAYTNVYILMAEGEISGIGRYDYVTNYSDLTNIAKEFLRFASASLAAIFVISYDMSAYTSRIEAEDMLNILWAQWSRARKRLLDQKVVTWAKS